MESREENGIVFARLDEGRDIHEQLKELAARHNVRTAVIPEGVGMLEDPELGYFNVETKKYENKVFAGCWELVSLQGNFSRLAEDGEPILHLHAGLGGRDHKLIGGHLHAGKVRVTGEIVLRRLPNVTAERVKDAKYGLNLLQFR